MIYNLVGLQKLIIGLALEVVNDLRAVFALKE